VFSSKTSVEEEIVFEEEEDDVEVSGKEADCRQRQEESEKKRVPMDPPKETTAVRYMAMDTREDTKRVSIDPPAAMAGEEWHQDDPGEDQDDPEEEWHPEDPEEINPERVSVDDDVEKPCVDEVEVPCHVKADVDEDEEGDVLIKEEDLEDEANDSLVDDALETHEEVGSLVDTDEVTVVTDEGNTEENHPEEMQVMQADEAGELRPEETRPEYVSSSVTEEVNGIVDDNRPHPEVMQETQVDEADER